MKGQLILISSSENQMVTIKTEKLSRAQLECANHSVKSHGSLKSEVQHPPSGKVHSCKSVRHTASFNLRSA
jgi:hypothetical protein